MWGYCVLSAIVTHIRQIIADFKLEPFIKIDKEVWIDLHPSITYDADGGIHSMMKCPPIYPETQCSTTPECPASYTDDQFEDLLMMAVGMFILIVVFLVHIILLCLMTEEEE